MTQLKILIAGAGIAGLAAKRAFALRGIEADIVERDPVPRTTGAGLYLPGNAVRALRDLGLHEPLMQVAEPVYRQELRMFEGGYSLAFRSTPSGATSASVWRSAVRTCTGYYSTRSAPQRCGSVPLSAKLAPTARCGSTTGPGRGTTS